MKNFLFTGVLFCSIVLCYPNISCKEHNDLVKEKNDLANLLKQKETIQDKINLLQYDIEAKDSTFNNQKSRKLVAVTPVVRHAFKHYLDIDGTIFSDSIFNVTPSYGGGQVRQVFIKQGDQVHVGQLLLKLDNNIINKNLQVALQNVQTLKSQLLYANDLFNRQDNLWKQGVGSEVQWLTAKNNKDNLADQLATAEANVNLLQAQKNATNVYSDVNGLIDQINVRPGETFIGQGQIRIVNTKYLKLAINIPEKYYSQIHLGMPVAFLTPQSNQLATSNLSFISPYIENQSRSFRVEAKVDRSLGLVPNLVVDAQVEDYVNPNAILINVNAVQDDGKGKFVYVVQADSNQLVAKKRYIQVGGFYDNQYEVLSGLHPQDLVITDGYQNLFDNFPVRLH
ncbi:MAG: efflux RND transporter periplasmic adaptor subunit [Phycisphaerales bacterium]|nr:efflux RND transporter periplasmic adaptor subunit [Phycisphaerales bacterium]